MRTPQPLPDGAAERLAALLPQAQNKAEFSASCGVTSLRDIETRLGCEVVT